MEEGGEGTVTPSSVYKGSEEVFDVICAPCSRLGHTSEALDFCSDCSEYFCPACTKDHLKFGITSGHNVTNRTITKQAMQGKTSSGSDSLPTERCDVHTGELMTTYCADHGTVACDTCVSMDHRSCGRLHKIESVAGYDNTRRTVPKVKQAMTESLNAIQATRKHVHNNITKADDERKKHIKHVKDHTERLIKHAHDMERVAIDEITTLHKETTETSTADLASLDKAEATLEKRMKSLDKADTTSDSQVFIDIKLGAKEAKSTMQLEQRVKSTSSTFVLDNRFGSFLNEVKSFGKVVKNKAFSAVFNDTHAIKMEEDNEVCDIADMCELSDGTIIMADHANSRIKTLDKTYRVVKSFVMRSKPWGICQISRNEAAVTLTTDRKVQFVNVRESGKMTKSFSVKAMCRGIAHSGDELYVACEGSPGSVKVYDMSGSLRRQIQFDSQDRQLFSVPYHIVTTHNGENIHIADKANGVITVDRSGRLLSTFKERVKWCLGLCKVNDENLIVCDSESNTVTQINTHGGLVAELLGRQDGIREPECVLYSRSTSTLAIAFDSSDEIKVFDLLL